MNYIKDPLYGYLELTKEEMKVLDSPQVQRLRNIKQLGLSSTVYPGATHTRFEHSLGVMHLAGKFADSLDLYRERRKEVRIAALLHDTGHGPFSHSSETIAKEHGKSHEEYSCNVIEKLEDRYSCDPKRLKKMITGDLELGSVVAGDIDSDRMDYLMRDAHASGLEHGHIDYQTIIRCAEIDSRRLVFDQKAVDSLESLFTSRFHMLKTLYHHHAAVIAEKMLERSFRELLSQDHSIDQLMRMDDREAHSALMNSEGVSKEIYSRVDERRLFKRALVLGPDEIKREQIKTLSRRIDPEKVEREISEKAGVESWKVIVDPPEIPEIHDIDVKIKKGSDVEPLADNSPVPDALAEAEWRTADLRVYAPKECREKVEKAAGEVIKDYSSVLQGFIS